MAMYLGTKRNPKNLIPFPYHSKSQTINGITFTVQDDGSVKVEGTATGTAQFYFSTGENIEVSAGKTVTISGGVAPVGEFGEIVVNIRKRTIEGNSANFVTSKGLPSTGTLLEGETPYGCSIYITEGVKANTIIKPMLNEGTKAEPYTVGQAVKILAPSINLFDKSGIHSNGWDFSECSEWEISADKNAVTVRGNSHEYNDFGYSGGWVRPTYIEVANERSKGVSYKKGDIVIVSADFTLIEQGNRSAGVRCYLCDAKNSSNDITLVNQQSISETKQRLTWKFTAIGDGDGYYPCFPINSNKVKIENITMQNASSLWRIRSGVNMGRNPKNLITVPYADTSVLDGGTKLGVTYTIADDGVITLNGTSTEQTWYALKLNFPIEEGKTYTISGAYGSKSSSYWRVMIELYTADKKFLQSYASMDGAFTFTANAGTSYGNLYVYVGKGHTYNNQVFKPMLNEGTKALPYYYYD